MSWGRFWVAVEISSGFLKCIPIKSSGLIYCNILISAACALFEQRGFGPCFEKS